MHSTHGGLVRSVHAVDDSSRCGGELQSPPRLALANQLKVSQRVVIHGEALVAKLPDDLSEEALATSAGSARWYGLVTSSTLLLLQKGREVRLRPGKIIEKAIVRERSALPAATPAQ